MNGRIATATLFALLAGCAAPSASPPETAATIEPEAVAAPAPAPEPVPDALPEPDFSPLRAKVDHELSVTGRPVTFLTMQAMVDEVTLNSTELNRGNCETYPYTSRGDLPVTLRYGEEIRVEMKGCGDLLEAVAMTSFGEVTFDFEPAIQ